MIRIRVDTAELRRAALEIDEASQEFRGLAGRALSATKRAPSYDRQFGPDVWNIGDEANALMSTRADRLAELSQELDRIAEAFEFADEETQISLQDLGLRIQGLVGTGLANPLLGLLLSAIRPSNISKERWNMLPIEDRISFLRGLKFPFPFGEVADPGTVLYVLNPLRIREDPGLNGAIKGYAIPGSEILHTGQSEEADGITWYAVEYKYAGAVVIGWVGSGFLSTKDRVRVGYEPDTVRERFDVQLNQEVRDAGGRLMSVTSNWLQIQDGPTTDYAAPEAVELGQVVRWTGDYIREGDHTWYEVITWTDPADGGPPEALTGWARADRVVDYEAPAGATQAQDGYIYVPENGDWNASYYTVTDVDAYASVQHKSEGFDSLVPIPWKEGFRPEGIDGDILVPYGSLYTPEGAAMQGSAKMTLENGEVLYFQLDNPRDLEWEDSKGDKVWWETDKQWIKSGDKASFPAKIANSEVARFRPGSRATELEPGISVAASEKYRGMTLYIPELAEFSPKRDGLFEVADAGAAFGAGEQRIDVFHSDIEAGRIWHNDTWLARSDGFTLYVERPIPPELEQIPSP